MNSDDEMDDPSFMAAVAALEAQHVKQTQANPQPLRGSQPSSPLQVAGGMPPRQPSTGQLAPAGLFHQQPAAPLQQMNGVSQSMTGSAAVPMQKASQAPAGWPPMPPMRQHASGQQPGPTYGRTASTMRPPGLKGSGHQQWAQPPPHQQHPRESSTHSVGMHAQDLQARLAQVQAELSRSEGQNKLLTSNLQQKDRELSALRQQKQQLERAAAAAGQAGGSAGMPHRPSFAMGEMQRHLESAQKQLAFKEAEMEDLRRQHAERTERLRQTEATLADLREQMKQSEQEAAGNGASSVAAAAEQGRSGGGAAAASGRQRRSCGQASSAALPAQRSSGQKRRQSAGTSGTAAPQTGPPAAAAPAAPPLLDPAVLAAASNLTSSASVVAQLMAACSASMTLLAGGTPGDSSSSSRSNTASTALLLRSRLAAAEQATDADSLAFSAAFSRYVQQVACGMLPPSVLLDSIASLAAASVAQMHSSSSGSSSGADVGTANLPEQRLWLLAAGLHVAQHLIELDQGCQAAALAPPAAASSTSYQGSVLPAPRRQLSGRVLLTGSSGSVAAALEVPSSMLIAAAGSLGGASSAAVLPGTALLVLRHASAFADLQGGDGSSSSTGSGGVLLMVVLKVVLLLGQQHEAVAAGALGTLLELARAMHGDGGRLGLAPIFTTGAMELFMQAPGLRLQAISLLHLLLEDVTLAQLFESSLAQAAAARGEPGPPTATAATTGQEGGGGSTTPGRPGQPAAGGDVAGGEDRVQAMQLEGQQHEAAAGRHGADCGPWLGAAVIAERLLESFVLDDVILPALSSCSGGAAALSGLAEPASTAANADLAACGGTSVAAARAAMQLVAMLREQRQRNILLALLLDDACGAPGCMLAHRLIQLAEAASAPSGDDADLMLLCPAQWPSAAAAAPASIGSGNGSNAGMLLQQQAAWQQRLRVVQEALTLLRGLLVDDSCGVSAMDDLVAIPAAARLTLTTLSRLARLEPPPAAWAALLPPPLPLAPWARAIGSSTDHASIAEANGGGYTLGGLPGCNVDDAVYMAKSCRRRVLARMQQASMQQGC